MKQNKPLEIKKTYQPTIEDIKNYFISKGVVGEQENAILLTLAITHKIPVGVEAPAGSGKTVLTDVVGSLLPQDLLYNMGLMSGTAAVYDSKLINNSYWILIEELQKAMNSNNPIMVELLKNLTEGKDLNRKTVEMTGSGFKTSKQHIKGDKGIIYTLALENKLKKDEELGRRVLVLSTDITEKQNKNVIIAEGKRRFGRKDDIVFTDKQVSDLGNHIVTASSMKLSFQNPFAEYIAKLVPTPNVIVRSYFKHYLNLMEASARFHFKDRLMEDGKIYLTIQDIQLIHELYGRMFLNSIHHINDYGSKILSLFDSKKYGYKKNKSQKELYEAIEEDNNKRYLTIDDIHKGLKDKNILLKKKVLKDQCDLLIEAGFIGEEKSGNKTMYFKTDCIEDFEDKIDWNECFEEGKKLFKSNSPDIYDRWLETNKLLNIEEKKDEFTELSNIEIITSYMKLALKNKERVTMQKFIDLGFTEEQINEYKKNGYLVEIKPDDYRLL